MDIESLNTAFKFILPEAVLVGTACLLFLAGPFLAPATAPAEEGSRHKWGFLSLAAVAFATYLWTGLEMTEASTGPFVVDGLAWAIRGITLVIGTSLILLAWNQVDDSIAAECHACLLILLAGVNIAAASNDLVSLFLGLEMVSIPTYVLLYLSRRSRETQEATIKYFLLSVFSSGMLLYSFALAYGATGSTSLPVIQNALANATLSTAPLLILAVPFAIAGLGFRITAVPFHFYAPDVFQGVPTFMAALLSFIPKVVGFTALWRFSFHPGSPVMGPESWTAFWQMSLAAFAVVTMFVGNLMALRQNHLHRLLAYSSVAHAGYMMTGLLAGTGAGGSVPGGAALLFYLLTYGAMSIGAFAVLMVAGRNGQALTTTSQLNGLGTSRPFAAFLMSIFLLSMAGLPPMAGMFGKFNLFMALLSNQTSASYWLAAFMGINAAIAAFYYLRLIVAMYFQPATADDQSPANQNLAGWVACVGCAIATIGLFVAPQTVWDAALAAVR